MVYIRYCLFRAGRNVMKECNLVRSPNQLTKPLFDPDDKGIRPTAVYLHASYTLSGVVREDNLFVRPQSTDVRDRRRSVAIVPAERT